MGEMDQLPATAPVDPVQAYRDAVAYAGMLRQGALGSAAMQFAQDGDQAAYGAAVKQADFDYYTALAHSALRYGQPLTGVNDTPHNGVRVGLPMAFRRR
jgi:hypothetical protein